MLTEGVPVWKANDSATECTACGLVFNMLIRRHHCRYCGHIFCNECCHHKHHLVIYGYCTPVRVCNKCIKKIVHTEDLRVAVQRNEIGWITKQMQEV